MKDGLHHPVCLKNKWLVQPVTCGGEVEHKREAKGLFRLGRSNREVKGIQQHDWWRVERSTSGPSH